MHGNTQDSVIPPADFPRTPEDMKEIDRKVGKKIHKLKKLPEWFARKQARKRKIRLLKRSLRRGVNQFLAWVVGNS